MAIAGLMLLMVGAVLWWVQRRQQGRSTQLKLARAAQAADLKSTAAAVAQEIGGGDWRDYVWLWGTPAVPTPLLSELKQVPCVAYTSTVIREYKETVQEKDSSGEVTTRTQRGSETVSEHQQRIPFALADTSGQVHIDPEGGKLEPVEVLNEFRPGTPPGGMLSFGAFSLVLGGNGPGHRHTLGYRYKEAVLPLDRPLLVVGMASDAAGTVAIAQPHQPGQPYIITPKSYDAITRGATQSAQAAFWAMAVCTALGGLLLLAGLLA